MTTQKIKLLDQLLAIRGGAALHTDALGKKKIKIAHRQLGDFSFPLNAMQAKALISAAHPAPFGKGHETLVDADVRNTWEIDAEDLILTDKKLNKNLNKVLGRAADTLNIPSGINAIPYKLLIYEAGGFFLPHQDSEKLPGMFGTLLVGLPSNHSGGELHIEADEDKTTVVDFSENAAADFPAVAFLADQEHEVKPVTKGYRVVLVYNLVYADGNEPEHIDDEKAVENLVEVLHKLSTEEPLIFALEHQYTETNFSSEQLKQHDLPRVRIIRQAAAKAGFEMRVGRIYDGGNYNWENAYDFGHGYDYRLRYSGTEPKNFSEIEIGEEFDSHLYMRDWLPEDGSDLGQLNIKKEQLITGPSYQKDEPTDWMAEGYQGNWGMTVEFTYNYAGVVLWKSANTAKLLENMPLVGKINWVYDKCTNPQSADVDRANVLALLENIRKEIAEARYFSSEVGILADILGHLTPEEIRFGDWQDIFYKHFDKFPSGFWTKAVVLFGKNPVSKLLGDVANEKPKTYYSSVGKIDNIISALVALIESDNQDCQEIAQQHYKNLPDYIDVQVVKTSMNKDILRNLLRADVAFNPTVGFMEEIAKPILQPLPDDRSYLHDELSPALAKMKQKGKLHAHLLEEVISTLRQVTAEKPKPFTDLKRPIPGEGLNSIVPGIEAFMNDPTKDTFHYKATKSYRSHAESILSRAKLDLAYSTLRTRPSHTLVLTKTDASYYRAVEQYQKDLKLLEKIEKNR